ncbi:MAG TPA: hypothetical protein VK659_18875 [Asanoa sp.]|nr:hypothetical protein [Asanoa sp.]
MPRSGKSAITHRPSCRGPWSPRRARLLDDDWEILVNESRPRTAAAPAGTSHVRDIVLRAQRLR